MIHSLAAAAVLWLVGHARVAISTYGNPGGMVQAVSLYVPEAGALLPCSEGVWKDCQETVLHCERKRDFTTTNCTGTQPCTYTISNYCLDSVKTAPQFRFKVKDGVIVKVMETHP